MLRLVWVLCLLGLLEGVAAAQAKQGAEDIPAALLKKGSDLWLKGDPGGALEKFRTISKKYPTCVQAAQARFCIARLFELNNEWVNAFAAYEELLSRHKSSPYYSQGVKGQYSVASKIFDRLMENQANPLKELPRDFPKPVDAAAMFKVVVGHAKYSDFAPKAQYRLAVALEQVGFIKEAKDEHESIIQHFPKHYLADDAAFQSAYIDVKQSRKKGGGGTGPTGARQQAILSLGYFLFNYPESEKVPQANLLIAELRREGVEELARTARYYEANKKPDSAVLYWKELLKQPPEVLKLVPQIEAEARGQVEASSGIQSSKPAE